MAEIDVTGSSASLNDPALLAMREHHMARLTRFFADPLHGGPFGLCGTGVFTGTAPEKLGESWSQDMCQAAGQKASLVMDEQVFRPLGIEIWLYGVHFVDKIFGAEIEYRQASDLWWSHGVKNDIGQLAMPDFASNPLWQSTVSIYETLTGCGRLPFITTQVLGSPIVGLFNLYKEPLLYAFYDQPEAVFHDLRILTDALIYMHQWFISRIPADQFQPVAFSGRCQPRGFGQMCGCTTQLLSKPLYDAFIKPFDEEILSLYPGGGLYHLCGSHTQHIPTWRTMKSLRAVQLNDRASDDFAYYFTGLRDDQIIYLNPSEHMTIERAMAISGGKRLVLVGDPDQIRPFLPVIS